jgi:hypothetical protein
MHGSYVVTAAGSEAFENSYRLTPTTGAARERMPPTKLNPTENCSTWH